MNIRALIGALLLCIGALFASSAMADPQFPKLTGRVVDDANILPPDVEQRLTQKLDALDKQSQRQFVIATIPDLQGYEISDYGYQLGRAWGIGDKQRSDGVLLIVAPKERKLRIETGYGVEGVLPDGMSFLIINDDIVPQFKAGNMPAGIEAGADAIIKQLTLPLDQAQQIAAQAVRQNKQGGGIPLGAIIFMLFILFFFILPIIRSASGVGGRRRRGFGGPIIWAPGGFGGGGGGWGGGGGGGGFSGGGGSFGGGGASGGW